MKKIVHVAAAVITRPDGSFLLGQRAPDTFYPGYWEFPGGKVEPGETPRDALIRELDEELGMQVEAASPWITREHVYEHAHVSLHFFEVSAWRGEIHDRVHSALSWQQADAMDVGPMLPANGPILKALRLPRLFGITHAGEIGIDAQLARLDAALASDLRLVQIREPALPEADAVVVLADQPRSLRQEQDAAGRAVIDILRHLRRDLAGQIGADAGDERGGNHRPGLKDVRRRRSNDAIGRDRPAIGRCVEEGILAILRGGRGRRWRKAKARQIRRRRECWGNSRRGGRAPAFRS